MLAIYKVWLLHDRGCGVNGHIPGKQKMQKFTLETYLYSHEIFYWPKFPILWYFCLLPTCICSYVVLFCIESSCIICKCVSSDAMLFLVLPCSYMQLQQEKEKQISDNRLAFWITNQSWAGGCILYNCFITFYALQATLWGKDHCPGEAVTGTMIAIVSCPWDNLVTTIIWCAMHEQIYFYKGMCINYYLPMYTV